MRGTKAIRNFAGIAAIAVVCSGSSCDQDDIKRMLEAQAPCREFSDLFAPGGPLADENISDVTHNANDSTVWLNPDRVRKILFQGNTNLAINYVRLKQSKHEYQLARSELYPKVGLGAVVSSLSSPTFLLSSVFYTLPFLNPANWFNMSSAGKVLDSARVGFLLTDLNEYSAAYAIYQSMQLDFVGRSSLEQDRQDAMEIERLISQAVQLGQADPEIDSTGAEHTYRSTVANMYSVQRTLTSEDANIKMALGLCQDVDVGLEDHHLPPSIVETESWDVAVKEIEGRAPELVQLQYLMASAKANSWKAAFSWIDNPELSSSASSGQNASFAIKDMKATGSITIGDDTYRNYEISRDNEDLIAKQYVQSKQLLEQQLKVALGEIQLIQSQVANLKRDEAVLAVSIDAEQREYLAGNVNLETVIQIREEARQKRLERLRAEADLDLSRLYVHRLDRTEAFQKVSGCWTPEQVQQDKLEGKCDQGQIQRLTGRKISSDQL